MGSASHIFSSRNLIRRSFRLIIAPPESMNRLIDCVLRDELIVCVLCVCFCDVFMCLRLHDCLCLYVRSGLLCLSDVIRLCVRLALICTSVVGCDYGVCWIGYVCCVCDVIGLFAVILLLANESATSSTATSLLLSFTLPRSLSPLLHSSLPYRPIVSSFTSPLHSSANLPHRCCVSAEWDHNVAGTFVARFSVADSSYDTHHIHRSHLRLLNNE